jgi:predicted amidophosphoribosyltransferase
VGCRLNSNSTPGPAKTDGVLCGASVRDRPPFQRARAVMVYGDFSRKIVLALKHGDRTDTAPAAN